MSTDVKTAVNTSTVAYGGAEAAAKQEVTEDYNYAKQTFLKDMSKFRMGTNADQVSIFTPKSTEETKEAKTRGASANIENPKEEKGFFEALFGSIFDDDDVKAENNPFNSINNLLDENSQIDFNETCETLEIISDTINKGVPKQLFGAMKDVANTIKAMDEGYESYKPYSVPITQYREFVA